MPFTEMGKAGNMEGVGVRSQFGHGKSRVTGKCDVLS